MVDTATASLLDAAKGDLVLRICGSVRHGQIVRLRSRKCTIGSGPRSTLRLHARNVQPLHCLILRGTAVTVVRRWAMDTRLNGRTFTDSPLHPGDRLGIGSIEFEVLDTAQRPEPYLGQTHQTPSTPFATATIDRGDVDESARRQDELDRRRQTLADQSSKLNQLKDDLDARTLELDSQQDAFQHKRSQWETEQARARRQIDQRAEQLDARQAELDAEREALEQERHRWDADRETTESESTEQTQQLEARLADLDTQREAFQQHRSQWEAEQAGAQHEMNQRAEQLDARHGEFDARRKSTEEECRQWDAERIEVEKQLRERAEQLDARQAELDAQDQVFQQRRRQWEAGQAAVQVGHDGPAADVGQPEGVQSEQPSEGSPVDTAEVLRRLGVTPLLPDDEPREQAAPELERAGNEISDSPPPPQEPAAEEESVDEYMARLLERIQAETGGSTQPAVPSRASRSVTKEADPAASTSNASESPQGPSPSQAAEAMRREPVEISPRAVAPEKVVDLTAMRELANVSAHTAIDRHAKEELSRATGNKLLVTLVGLVTGAVLIWWMSRSSESNDLTISAAVAGFLVAAIWGYQYITLIGRKLFRRGKGKE